MGLSRIELADLAERYVRGDVSHHEFLLAAPEDADPLCQDEEAAELLMLLEHIPAVGGLLGVGEGEAESYASSIQEAIAALRR